MPITYNNTWDEIQEALILAAGAVNERRQARDAFEIKSAIETIQRQERISYLLDALGNAQRPVTAQTKKLAKATSILAVLTGLLFLSTAFYAIVSFFMWSDSQKQLDAVKGLKTSIENVEKSIFKLSVASENQISAIVELQKSLQGISTTIDKLGQSVQKIPAIATFIKSSEETRKRIEEGQIKERQRGLIGR